jgi:N-acetylmuramoyl-L-alanine amidase
MALRRVWIGSPNWSSRGGASTRLIVCHTAQGATTKESLGAFFQGDVGASSHVGIDDEAGVIAEYVERPDKAWTQASYNPVCVSAELCAFAEWTPAEWARHPAMLDNLARWIAEEATHFGVPIRILSGYEAQNGMAGVCQHVDLGAAGGGHWDCGPGLPIEDVVADALKYAVGDVPAARPKGGSVPLFIRVDNDQGEVYEEVQAGEDSYWRGVQKGLVADLEAAGIPIVADPNRSWLQRWQVGADK